MFITLYGINNIGKTTHTKRLVEELQRRGYDAVRLKYPVYAVTPSGSYLNQLLRSGTAQPISEEELQLWFVLNRYQFEPTLKQWLSEGKIIVAEDYVGTGIAWGTVKGVSTEWLETLNAHLLKEDLALLLDGERAKKAIEKGHLHEENEEWMARCRTVLLGLAGKYGWKRVELRPTKDETFDLLWKTVEPLLPAPR